MELGQPNYVLKFDDAISVYIDGGGIWGKIQKICLIVIGIFVVASFVFHENLFREMSGYAVGMLIAILVVSWVKKKREWRAFPIELRFYDDSLVIYRDQVPREDGKKLRQEWSFFKYEDIKLVRWQLKAKSVVVQGIMHGIYICYDENGQLTEKKKYDKITDSGCIFNTHNMGDIDLVREIEEHSPLKVEVSNT